MEGAWRGASGGQVVFVPDRQVEQRAGDEAVPLIVAGIARFLTGRVGVLRLFVEIRCRVPRV